MKRNKIPKWLQPVLWSCGVDELNLNKSKVYIINQILGFGGVKALKWLFKSYSEKTIKNIFINKPLKVYSKKAFHFAKEILLNIKNDKLDLYQYDTSLPRIIRPQ